MQDGQSAQIQDQTNKANKNAPSENILTHFMAMQTSHTYISYILQASLWLS